MTHLYTLNDGSSIHTMSAKEFITIPTWHGNRSIDHSHVESIQKEVGTNIKILDNGYKLALFHETDAGGSVRLQPYIIDGQHRAEVLKKFYNDNQNHPDFTLIVVKRHVESEGDAIQYFNTLNHTKSIQWTDPNLIINMYISDLEKTFNTPKVSLIRVKSTHRPYLSSEKIRQVLQLNQAKLKVNKTDIDKFIERVKKHNLNGLEKHEKDIAYSIDMKDEAIVKKAVELKFTLAMNPKLPWLTSCL